MKLRYLKARKGKKGKKILMRNHIFSASSSNSLILFSLSSNKESHFTNLSQEHKTYKKKSSEIELSVLQTALQTVKKKHEAMLEYRIYQLTNNTINISIYNA